MFWIWYVLPFRPGKSYRCVVAYLRNSGLARPSRANSARSYADETWPGASSPLGLTARVSKAPSRLASSFINRIAAGTPPLALASALAASLPDGRKRP